MGAPSVSPSGCSKPANRRIVVLARLSEVLFFIAGDGLTVPLESFPNKLYLLERRYQVERPDKSEMDKTEGHSILDARTWLLGFAAFRTPGLARRRTAYHFDLVLLPVLLFCFLCNRT